MRRAVLVVVFCLLACGGSDGPAPGNNNPPPATPFAGLFHGTLLMQGPCSDGTSVNSSTNSTWSVSQTGSSVSLGTDGACDIIPASASGSSASVGNHQCRDGVDAASGTTIRSSITSGTVAVSGSSLSVNLNVAMAITSPSISGTCNPVVWSGTLVKQ